MNQNELYHYGVLGMKWGVRRYQNKDGTLTSEGKKRYGSSSKKQEEFPTLSELEKMSPDEYQKISPDKRLKIAQQYGKEAFDAYSKIESSNIWEQINKLVERGDYDAANRLEDELYDKRDKAVEKLYKAGYEWVDFGGGSVDGEDFMSLQFGRMLDHDEIGEYGERWVDDFMIDNRDRKAYRLDY